MKYAKLFSLLVFSIMALYGAVGFYFLPLATFQAELTRMAMLPESMFGWSKAQPVIDTTLMHQSSWREADVLVIGDSFSDGRIWQTVLTKAGLHVRTESWDSVRGICEDFMPWVREQGFNGKYIVFESVERNIADGVARSVACKQMQFHPSIYADMPRGTPVTSFNPNHGDYSGKLSVGIQTLIRAWQYERLSRAPDFKGWNLPNGVKMARVNHGCDLFSHEKCNDALFLVHDRVEELPENTLDNVAKLNERLHGIKPIWVFIPNKSTAYLYSNKKFWDEAERRFAAPNLLHMTQQAIHNKTVDLYPANNTHFSTTGYLLMGDAVYQAIAPSAHPELKEHH